ncbi:MAG: 23S rRNA (adenine(2503)-C(2))-methyltransferase RlmN [Planctomycetes bacterium]|nr:23S rRNA (adenine(2503)-C(2))-methyltransferase RlmN [Planctomycetota bacterium]
MSLRNLFDVGPEELRAFVAGLGAPRFCAEQVLHWIYRRRADRFGAMANVPASVRRALQAEYRFGVLALLERQQSGRDLTTKFLLGLPEGDGIEAVFMRDRDRVTGCLSVQAGCPLACRFCATGYAGFTRNLSAGEIVEQLHIIARTLDPPTHVVYMGMGEPLLNVAAVMDSIRRLTDPAAFGLSPRRITVSTAGIVPGIERLATLERPVNLALSLHAPNDALRAELMPINRQYPLDRVIPALKRYLRETGRRITLEYIMIAGCNMEAAHAAELAAIARENAARINLVAFNPVRESGLRTPSAEEEGAFRDRLRALGADAMIRFRRGRDINAACGQLRGRRLETRSEPDRTARRR